MEVRLIEITNYNSLMMDIMNRTLSKHSNSDSREIHNLDSILLLLHFYYSIS